MSRIRITISGVFESTVQRLVASELLNAGNWFSSRNFLGSLPSTFGAPSLGVASKGIELGAPLAGGSAIQFVSLRDAGEDLAFVRSLRMTPDELSEEVNGVTALKFDDRVAELKDSLFDGRKQTIRADKGSQTVEGGDLKDNIKTGRGNDLGVATTGNDKVDLGAGKKDVYSFEALAEQALEAALVWRKGAAEILGFTQSVVGAEQIVGTPNDDLMVGSGRANVFFGLPGDD
ncbi:MAG: hypothetical protein AAF192_15470, partial [Pseudomonadota bacterium]